MSDGHLRHVCEVCFTYSDEHVSPGYWPPLCCPGCPCGETQGDPE